MGVITTQSTNIAPTPLGNRARQVAIDAAIRSAQAEDPMAPVTLLVEAGAQGWALRRQLAMARSQGQAVANVHLMTPHELLVRCSLALGRTPPGATDDVVRAAISEHVLARQIGPLAASAGHPDSAILLARLADELAWCRLDDASCSRLADSGASTTTLAGVAFVVGLRRELRDRSGELPLAELADDLAAALREGPTPAPIRGLGTIIETTGRVPNPLAELLTALGDHVPVVRAVAAIPGGDAHSGSAPSTALIPAHVLSCPDPTTEVAMAVRHGADALASGTPPHRIAILHSGSAPYPALLGTALAEAALVWHGPSSAAPASSTVVRAAMLLAQMGAARGEHSSGITRPLLMRWLGLGGIHDAMTLVPTGQVRALIRREALLGDAISWPPLLTATAASPEARGRLAEVIADLISIIERLDVSVGQIASAPSWAALGDALWQAVTSFHLRGTAWRASEAERSGADALHTLLSESLPQIDTALSDDARPPSAAALLVMMTRHLSSRATTHGAGAAGFHVGPLASGRGLVFDTVILVGAAEGLLPTVGGDDALLPDSARVILRTSADDLPTVAEREVATHADLWAISSPSATTVATFPRGALPSGAVGVPSRYLADNRGQPEGIATQFIPSARAALMLDPAPVVDLDLVLRAAGGAPTPSDLADQVLATIAWARPSFDEHTGNLAGTGAAPTWTPNGMTLSASAIEMFLRCPYHFFVQRVLGISTDEHTDEVDTMSPADLGTLLHGVLQRFVDEGRDRGTLPGPGQAWSASALEDLRALLEDEGRRAAERGATGWAPAWQGQYRLAEGALEDLLETDAQNVRAEPPTRPYAAEQRFGFEEGPQVAVRVTDDVVVLLRGSIDRVDLDGDGTHVGVVDYKTGSSKGFALNLGKPAKRARGGTTAATPPPREKVQDLVYDAGARALYPDARTVDVRFVFVPNGGQGVAVINANHESDRPQRLVEVLAELAHAGEVGQFPPRPAKNAATEFCPVCRRLGRVAHSAAEAAAAARAAAVSHAADPSDSTTAGSDA